MTGSFVADASVGVAWAVASQSSGPADRLLEATAGGAALVVPVLWHLEVANALLALSRRRRLSPEHRTRAQRALRLLTPVLDEEGPRAALSAISDLAQDHGLSVYDAAYLELALRRGLPLASRDAGLNRAAQRAGVATLL